MFIFSHSNSIPVFQVYLFPAPIHITFLVFVAKKIWQFTWISSLPAFFPPSHPWKLSPPDPTVPRITIRTSSIQLEGISRPRNQRWGKVIINVYLLYVWLHSKYDTYFFKKHLHYNLIYPIILIKTASVCMYIHAYIYILYMLYHPLRQITTFWSLFGLPPLRLFRALEKCHTMPTRGNNHATCMELIKPYAAIVWSDTDRYGRRSYQIYGVSFLYYLPTEIRFPPEVGRNLMGYAWWQDKRMFLLIAKNNTGSCSCNYFPYHPCMLYISLHLLYHKRHLKINHM